MYLERMSARIIVPSCYSIIIPSWKVDDHGVHQAPSMRTSNKSTEDSYQEQPVA